MKIDRTSGGLDMTSESSFVVKRVNWGDRGQSSTTDPLSEHVYANMSLLGLDCRA